MTREQERFLAEVVSVARRGRSAVLESVCTSLERLSDGACAGICQAVVHELPQEDAREAVSRLLTEWTQSAREVSPAALAWVLRTAGHAVEDQRRSQSIELVWTGPVALATTHRRTDRALLDLIHAAARSLMIVAFTAYRVPDVTAALSRAAGRGVKISLVAESAERGWGGSSEGY